MRFTRAIWKVSLAALLSTCPSYAQTALDSSTSPLSTVGSMDPGAVHSRASDKEASADTSDALPGIHRVGIPALAAPHYGAAATVSYGYIEPQSSGADPHHRIGGSIAAGLSPFSFAEFGLRLDYRYDMHGSDTDGSDQSSSLDVTPLIRSGGDIGHGVHLGAEVRVPFLGAAAVDGVAAPTLDARLLAAYLGLPTWRFAMHAGYKLGTSGDVVTHSDNLRAGDRVTLGLSEFDSILLGLGLSKRIVASELLAEVTSEILVGSGAPAFSESPLRVAFGLRQSLLSYLALSAMVEVSPLTRAASMSGDPLVPIEPRVSAMLGVMVRIPEKKSTPPPVVKETPKPTPAPPPVKVVAPTTSVRIVLSDQTGHPISDATVRLDYPATETSPARSIEVPLLSTNLYVMDGLPLGDATLTVHADLLEAHSQPIKLAQGTPSEVSVTLQAQATRQSQLRGLVRSYSGAGIAASVSVTPGTHGAICNDQGEFEIELPPGTYEVTISADGFQTQKRSLRVQDEGVTVLNADLQKD